MKLRTALTVSTAALALAGCRIELSTTGGGSIITSSGNFTCGPGAACPVVEVTDLLFDETFIAEPEPGFEFVGWRRRNRGLCGGSTQNCRLFTAGFAGNDLLLAFLENDELFYLEAVFEPIDSGGSGTGNARSCWNDALVTPGTAIVASYRNEDGLGNVIDFEYDQFIEGGARFQGKNVLRATTNTTSFGEFASTTLVESYFQVSAPQRTRTIGSQAETITPEEGSVETVFEPFRLDRFDLAAGQSFSQNYTVSVISNVGGFEFSETLDVRVRITFDGIESVTVPAGTFQACRISERNTTGGFTVDDTKWFHVGSGLLLKSETDGATTELKAGSVNGADI